MSKRSKGTQRPVQHKESLNVLVAHMREQEICALVALALDRPVLEELLFKEAKGRTLDLQGLEKHDLASAILLRAKDHRAAAKSLRMAIAEASAIQRQKLLETQPDLWPELLSDALPQARAAAKFMLALASFTEPTARELLVQCVAVLREQTSGKQDAPTRSAKSVQANVDATVHALAEAPGEALPSHVAALEQERARLIAEVGRAAAERKRFKVQEPSAQAKHQRRSTDAAQSLINEHASLMTRLRTVEKEAAFVREREDDRVKLQRISNERDHLLSDNAMLRTQLHMLMAGSRSFSSGPSPELEAAPALGQTKVAKKIDGFIGLFVDGANLSATARRLYGRALDFEALRARLIGRAAKVLAVAYVVDDGSDGFVAFSKRLRAAGYEIVRCKPKRFADGTVKADQDVALTVDVLTKRDDLSRVILCSGDGDFVPLIKALKRRQITVEVAAFAPRTAEELIGAADHFTKLDEGVTC